MSKALELAKFGRESAPTGAVIGDTDTQTLSSKTFSDGPVFSGLTANGIPYLNASKVLSSSSTFIFDGTNIGLGIASPAATLHVNASGGGTIRASRSSVGGEYIQLDHDGTDGTLRVSGNNRLNLLTNGLPRIIVTGGGSVGVGGALPLEVLSVINSNYEAFGIYRNLDYNSVGAMGTRMYFGGFVGTTATRSAAIDGTLMTATTGRLSFSTLISGNLTEAMRVDTNGSVRIGGTFAALASTNEKLTVDGSTSQAATLANTSDTNATIYIRNRSTTAATIQPYLYFSDGSGNRAGYGVKITDASTHQFAQGGFNWYIGSAGFSGLAATLTSTGLLINNSGGNSGVASAPVHVSANGLSNTYGTIRIEGANRGGILEMYNATYPVSKIITDQSGNFAIQTSALFGTSTLYDRFTIGTSGDVQIATSTNLGGGRLEITSNATAIIQARSSAAGTGDGTTDVTVTRAVTSGANWWANARYDAYSHTWGRGGAASATTGMLLNGSGNLAIGTTSNTTEKLNVNGSLWLIANNDANYSTIIAPRYDSSWSFTMQTRLNSASFSEWLGLYSDGGGGNPRLSLVGANGWPVGIGTTTPNAKLHVKMARTSSTSGVILLLSDNVVGGQTDGVYKAIRSGSNGDNSVSEIRFVETDGSNNNTAIAFATQSTAGGLTERVRIGPNGKTTFNGPPQMMNSGFNFNSIDKDASSGSVTFTYGELGGGMDNMSALVIIHVYLATSAVPGKSAIWFGTRQAARGSGGTVTQISVSKEQITTLTVATSGDSTVVTCDSGANIRCRLTVIAGGGVTTPSY